MSRLECDQYRKLVGRVGDKYVFLDLIGDNEDGGKEVHGTLVDLQVELPEKLDLEFLYRFRDVVDLDECFDRNDLDVLMLRVGGRSRDRILGEVAKLMLDNEYIVELRNYNILSDEDFPIFEKVESGEIFARLVFDEIYNQELFCEINDCLKMRQK